LAIETVASLLRAEIPTLVFCRAGMSRSPSVVAAALSLVEGGSPEDRLRQVVAGHPHDVSPQLWTTVREVCQGIGKCRGEVATEGMTGRKDATDAGRR
jgi:protein-tyrosine phosphatase